MLIYITGTSSGIGKALALQLLNEGHHVIGLSRSCTIEQLGYTHIKLDLSDLSAVSGFDFSTNIQDDIILINNAGVVGPIKPIGHQLDSEIIELNNINVIAPQILMNKFIHKFQPFDNNYQIMNISSGAGKNPIDAWATYCASKSAIDLFSETISQELKDRNHHNWKIFSIAPGVVDTAMQKAIRSSNPKDFLNHNKFIELKKNSDLSDPKSVAKKLINVISEPVKHPKVLFSVRDLT